MPVHVQAVSRRTFLKSTAMAGVTVLTWNRAFADTGADPNFLALLSDTHVPANRSITNSGVNMTENAERAIRNILDQSPRPAGVLINGDCAFLKGLTEDYRNLAATLEPLRQAKLPVHLLMGNHDHRTRMYEQLAWQRPDSFLVDGRHITVLRMPRANWFLLDSLFQTDVVTGEMGEAQLRWLDGALKAHADKPAIVMAHHDPQWDQPEGKTVVGVRDTKPLFDVLTAHKQVKAYLYGHRHRWERSTRDGIQLINLPACAYVFNNAQPNGWVSAHMRDDRLSLTLNAHDTAHQLNGEVYEVKWS